jgi:hypothetical protein
LRGDHHMKLRYSRFGFTALVAFAAGLLLTSGALAQNAAKPAPVTPHAGDGKPDLSGMWNGRNGGGGGGGGFQGELTALTPFPSRRCAPNQVGCGDQTNQTVDGEFTGRFEANRPLYKPEYWDKVQQLDRDTNSKDPIFQCQPYGVPRVGPPTKIVQTGNEVILFYAAGAAGTQPNDFRIIPIDGRRHDPVRALDVTYYGDSVGTWNGDTLVVDSVGFNDITWMDKGGYFHSDLMHVIEKFHRDGNTLTYSVTVDDPQVLLKPWEMTPKVLKLNTDPDATIHEGDPCRDYDQSNMSTRVRH